MIGPLTRDELRKIDAYSRAANYLRLIKKHDLNALFVTGPGHGIRHMTVQSCPCCISTSCETIWTASSGRLARSGGRRG